MVTCSGTTRGIKLEGDNIIVSNNQVISDHEGLTEWGIGIEYNSDNIKIQNNKISGNILNLVVRGNNARIIDNELTSSSINNIFISGDDTFIKDNKLSDSFNDPINSTGSNTEIRDNIGYKTENSGTATINNGTNFINVSHGLNITPSAKNLNVTPIESLNNASFFWVNNVTSTDFTINTNADPEQAVAFSWQITNY